MLLHSARSNARFDNGALVLLANQDRQSWDQSQIDEAIAAEHIGPTSPADTDWLRIVSLYDRLVDQTQRSPVVELNRAIALSEAHGPTAGLAAAEPLGQHLADYPYYHAAIADFHKRAGNHRAAAISYREAIRLSPSEAYRESLTTVLEELDEFS